MVKNQERRVFSSEAEQKKAWLECGQLLTDRYALPWVNVGGVWTWDRTQSRLHCKTLVCGCEKPTLEESLEALGAYAEACLTCPFTPYALDKNCVPLLQQAWRDATRPYLATHLDEVLPPAPAKKTTLRM